MNLYSIKPHDGETLYYATGKSYGEAVRKYKIKRTKDLMEDDWKKIPEPVKVVMVCDSKLLLAGRSE